MRFIKDAVRFPVFEEDEFAREKQVVIGELDRHMSEPGFYRQSRDARASCSTNILHASFPTARARPCRRDDRSDAADPVALLRSE